jgi:hypothetical protein
MMMMILLISSIERVKVIMCMMVDYTCVGGRWKIGGKVYHHHHPYHHHHIIDIHHPSSSSSEMKILNLSS